MGRTSKGMKDEEEISRMLASLKTVDAPEDFEGGVRSRIAKRREEPSLSRPSLLLVAKFAFPMLLLLAVGGFLIVSDSGTLKADMVPPVEDSTNQIAVVESPSDPPTASNANLSIEQAATNRGNSRSDQPSSDKQPSTQDDQALSQDDTTVFPDGVDPRKARITNGKLPTAGNISPTSILSMMGINAQCNSTGCVANDVREGTLAANAGIRSGDVISAVDGKAINASATFTGSFTISELAIIRGGRKMTVSLARR